MQAVIGKVDTRRNTTKANVGVGGFGFGFSHRKALSLVEEFGAHIFASRSSANAAKELAFFFDALNGVDSIVLQEDD